MKSQKSTTHRFALPLLLAALVGPGAQAAVLTWDTATGDGTTITEGGGTWQVGVGNWNDTGADVLWADGNEAVIGGGTLGAAGTITLGSDITTANAQFGLDFAPPAAGTYTVDLNGFTLTPGATAFRPFRITGGSSVTIDDIAGGGGYVTGTGAWSHDITGSVIINAKVTDTDGSGTGTNGRVYTAGAGSLALTNAANDFTGVYGKQNGGTLSFSSIGDIGTSSAAGAGDEIQVGFNARLAYTGDADTSTNRTLTFFGGNNGTLDNDGLGTLLWTGPFNNSTSGAAGTRNFTLGGGNAGDNEIRGTLADNGDKILNVVKNDSGTWLLSGANTHTGTTTVSGGILKINNDSALGDFGTTTSHTIVANNAKLQLDGSGGDLVIAEDITLGGGSGGIRNLAGDNTITGAVTLSNGADLRRDGGTLTFSGGINSIANQGISFNLPTIVDTTPINLNAGTLTITSNGNNPASGSELNVGGNDWGLLRINFGGYLTLGGANFLAADAPVEFGWNLINQSTATLDLNGFDQTVRSISQSSNSFGEGGNINITGGGTLTLDLDSGTREYQGRITDGATATALTKDGAGTQVLNNLSGTPSDHSGATTVNGGVLQTGSGNTLSANSSHTVASGGTLQLNGYSNCVGSLAGDGTVESGAAASALLSDDFESTGITKSGVRFREGSIDQGWVTRFNSEWDTTNGRFENDSTTAGGYPVATPAESALVNMFSNSADGATVNLQFDYDVAAGDTLYVHFRGHLGTPTDDGLIVGNTEPCNGAYSNNEGGSFTQIDAFNLKDGATSFGGGAANAIAALTGSGTYTANIDIASLGIDGIDSLGGFSHLSLAFCKDEDGLPGTTSIDSLSITSSQTTLATGADGTDTAFAGTIWDGTTGTLGLLKKGAGTQTLNSAATYTGLTTVTAGTLQVGNGGTTGSLATASNIVISADGTLCFNRSDTVTQGVDFSGDPIQGTGTFAVKGGGTVVLTNSGTFADTSITVSVEAGSTLQLDYAGTATIGALFLDGMQVNAGVYDSSDPSGLITGTGSLTVVNDPPVSGVPSIIDIAIDGGGNVILTLDGSEAGLTAQQSDDLTDGSFFDVVATPGPNTLTIDAADVDPNADGEDYYRVRN
ncbi:MAG: hypothetical protein HKO57_13030 [Akkermansiaceae bacterium]|nr:hypothetical protein [Akkermansiaceae bacterium]